MSIESPIVILAEPRTGSTWLVYILSGHGYAIPEGGNQHGELFNFNNSPAPRWRTVEDAVSWVHNKIRCPEAQKTVAKVCYDQLVQIQKMMSYNGPTVKLLMRCFPSAHFIRLRREDYIAQIVSLYIARQTNSYVSFDNENSTHSPPYDFHKMLHYWKTVRPSAADAFNVCCDLLKPLQLTYEELLIYPEHASLKISEMVGQPVSVKIHTPTEKQHMHIKDAYAKQFRLDLHSWQKEL